MALPRDEKKPGISTQKKRYRTMQRAVENAIKLESKCVSHSKRFHTWHVAHGWIPGTSCTCTVSLGILMRGYIYKVYTHFDIIFLFGAVKPRFKQRFVLITLPSYPQGGFHRQTSCKLKNLKNPKIHENRARRAQLTQGPRASRRAS